MKLLFVKASQSLRASESFRGDFVAFAQQKMCNGVKTCLTWWPGRGAQSAGMPGKPCQMLSAERCAASETVSAPQAWLSGPLPSGRRPGREPCEGTCVSYYCSRSCCLPCGADQPFCRILREVYSCLRNLLRSPCFMYSNTMMRGSLSTQTP